MPVATRFAPLELFSVIAAGTTKSKTRNSDTLPSEPGTVAAITGGAWFAPSDDWVGVTLDFAIVGSADLTLTVEIGQLHASSAMCVPLAAAALKSITTSGTIANVNPFTGQTTASTTWRLIDLVTLTAKGQLGQVLVEVGGTEDDTPSRLTLAITDASYYYVVVTNLSTITRALCVLQPK
jgi:hypothetical protein